MSAVGNLLIGRFEDLVFDFPAWTIEFEYGYYTAVHDNYDAEWQGEEDGWVDNGLRVSARTIDGLRGELEEKEAELEE